MALAIRPASSTTLSHELPIQFHFSRSLERS
jgi:hypothetical protein